MSVTTEPAAVERLVFDSLADFGAERSQISRDATFETLDVDSLDLAELAQIVEEEHGVAIKSSDVEHLKTVGDVIDLILARA